MKTWFTPPVLSLPLFLLVAGCAVGTSAANCALVTNLQVSLAATTADHSAAPPANQTQFTASEIPTLAPGDTGSCAIPALSVLVFPTWTNSDPLDISISSAQNNTNGTAVCNSSTSGPVTLTATVGSGTSGLTKTVQLTCQ